MRRRRRFDVAVAGLAGAVAPAWPPPQAPDVEDVADDHLRLLFTCCRPELPLDARIAMTLREVCGLTTEEIARAYLTRASTIAQRIVRAKQNEDALVAFRRALGLARQEPERRFLLRRVAELGG